MKQRYIIDALWAAAAVSAVIAVLCFFCFFPIAPTTPAPAIPKPAVQELQLAEIHAPDEVGSGQLVVLTARGSADSYRWQIIPDTNSFLVIEGGRRAVFSHGDAGTFLVVLAAARGGEVAVKTHSLRVSPRSRPQPVEPAPKPADSLSRKVADWCDAVELPSRRRDAGILADSFLAIARDLEEGKLKAPEEWDPQSDEVHRWVEQLSAWTSAANEAALGMSYEAWRPFFVSLNAELDSMSAEGKLAGLDAHVDAWRAIGQSLRQYSQGP